MLNKNPNLKVLEYGAPKNEYLINNNNLQERQQLQLKYMYKIDDDKIYIILSHLEEIKEKKSLRLI